MKRAVFASVPLLILSAICAPGSTAPFTLPEPARLIKDLQKTPPPPPLPEAGPVAAAADEGPVQGWSGRFDSAPDWSLTPGVLCTTGDEDFDGLRYPGQIPYCRRHLTVGGKKTVSEWYGVDWEDHSDYQYDHLISHCLGGSNDLRNIWPQPDTDARAKDKLETRLCTRLRKGEITQRAAVREELGWFADNAPELLEKILTSGTPGLR